MTRCEECEYYEKSNCSRVMPSGNSACVGFARRKKQTNADKIRQMTGEELAMFLRDFDMCIVCQVKCTKEYPCIKGILTWLKQEEKPDETGVK